MKAILVGAILALVAVLVFTVPAHSFTMAEQIIVGDDVLMVARVPAGGLSAAQRVAEINERIIRIISTEPLDPSNVRLAKLSGETVIMVGSICLMTVTTADAEANGASVEGLADRWVKNTKATLPQARPSCGAPRRLP